MASRSSIFGKSYLFLVNNLQHHAVAMIYSIGPILNVYVACTPWKRQWRRTAKKRHLQYTTRPPMAYIFNLYLRNEYRLCSFSFLNYFNVCERRHQSTLLLLLCATTLIKSARTRWNGSGCTYGTSLARISAYVHSTPFFSGTDVMMTVKYSLGVVPMQDKNSCTHLYRLR